MEVSQVAEPGDRLSIFLSGFDGCFGRSEPRRHLRTCVSGQLPNLRRKSIEPIARRLPRAGCRAQDGASKSPPGFSRPSGIQADSTNLPALKVLGYSRMPLWGTTGRSPCAK